VAIWLLIRGGFVTIHAQRAAEADVEIFEYTHDEWTAMIARDLMELGLTYEELQRQARESDFTSSAARHLWVVIGDSCVAACRD
jgi:hypothetical protein